MTKRDELRDEWHRLAAESKIASLDALRANINNDPDLEALCIIGHDATVRAREAEVRYRRAVEEERNT